MPMMKRISKKIDNFLMNEAPIGEFDLVGDFSKGTSFKRKVDRDILTSPKGQVKIRKIWRNTPIDFDMFFINTKHAAKYDSPVVETGVVDLEFVRKYFGDEVADKINPSSCTIIYTNNYGDEKVMMTGWILAHRLGHAIIRGDSELSKEMNFFISEAERIWAQLLDTVFGYQTPYRHDYYNIGRDEDIKRALFNSLGTMRSAREGKILRPNEFYYELFAQYLLKGKITFNDIPNTLILKRVNSKLNASDPDILDMVNDDLEYYIEELENLLEGLIRKLPGKILVM